MGLKRFLFGEDTVSEKADKIVKTKKMTLLDKYLTIKKLYIDYFKYHLEYDAKNSLYELHYEKIYKNGVLQPVEYQKLLQQETENLKFYNVFCLCQQFNKLIEQGIDIKLLKSTKEEFALDVINLTKQCKFGKNFDGLEFYHNKEVRTKVLNNIKEFIDKITDKKQLDDEKTM